MSDRRTEKKLCYIDRVFTEAIDDKVPGIFVLQILIKRAMFYIVIDVYGIYGIHY